MGLYIGQVTALTWLLQAEDATSTAASNGGVENAIPHSHLSSEHVLSKSNPVHSSWSTHVARKILIVGTGDGIYAMDTLTGQQLGQMLHVHSSSGSDIVRGRAGAGAAALELEDPRLEESKVEEKCESRINPNLATSKCASDGTAPARIHGLRWLPKVWCPVTSNDLDDSHQTFSRILVVFGKFQITFVKITFDFERQCTVEMEIMGCAEEVDIPALTSWSCDVRALAYCAHGFGGKDDRLHFEGNASVSEFYLLIACSGSQVERWHFSIDESSMCIKSLSVLDACQCEDRSLLYSAVLFLQPGQCACECIVVGGTVFRDILVWELAASSHGHDLTQIPVQFRLQGHDGVLFDLSASRAEPPARLPQIWSSSDDRTVRRWVPICGDNGKMSYLCEFVAYGHTARVFRVVVLADALCASGSEDGTCKIWSPTGQLLASMDAHAGSIWSVSANNGVVACGASDGSVRLWSFPQLLSASSESTLIKQDAVVESAPASQFDSSLAELTAALPDVSGIDDHIRCIQMLTGSQCAVGTNGGYVHLIRFEMDATSSSSRVLDVSVAYAHPEQKQVCRIVRSCTSPRHVFVGFFNGDIALVDVAGSETSALYAWNAHSSACLDIFSFQVHGATMIFSAAGRGDCIWWQGDRSVSEAPVLGNRFRFPQRSQQISTVLCFSLCEVIPPILVCGASKGHLAVWILSEPCDDQNDPVNETPNVIVRAAHGAARVCDIVLQRCTRVSEHVWRAEIATAGRDGVVARWVLTLDSSDNSLDMRLLHTIPTIGMSSIERIWFDGTRDLWAIGFIAETLKLVNLSKEFEWACVPTGGNKRPFDFSTMLENDFQQPNPSKHGIFVVFAFSTTFSLAWRLPSHGRLTPRLTSPMHGKFVSSVLLRPWARRDQKQMTDYLVVSCSEDCSVLLSRASAVVDDDFAAAIGLVSSQGLFCQPLIRISDHNSAIRCATLCEDMLFTAGALDTLHAYSLMWTWNDTHHMATIDSLESGGGGGGGGGGDPDDIQVLPESECALSLGVRHVGVHGATVVGSTKAQRRRNRNRRKRKMKDIDPQEPLPVTTPSGSRVHAVDTRILCVRAFRKCDRYYLVVIGDSCGAMRFLWCDSLFSSSDLHYKDAFRPACAPNLAHGCPVISCDIANPTEMNANVPRIVFTGDSHGFMKIWNVTDILAQSDLDISQMFSASSAADVSFSEDPIASVHLHQSGVNALCVVSVSVEPSSKSAVFVVATGGDDQALCVSGIRVSAHGKDAQCLWTCNVQLAHDSAIKGLATESDTGFLSSGYDQMIKHWRIIYPSNGDDNNVSIPALEKQSQQFTFVSDVSSIASCEGHHGLLAVGGAGVQLQRRTSSI